MDNAYRAQLPANVAALVTRIEDFANREIQVTVDTRPVSETDPNPDRQAIEVTERRATIYLRRKDSFPIHGVLHELLHIERFWLEGIPQVLPLRDPDGDRLRITSSIENVLEHQIIVPREADYGFEPYAYWNETELQLWGQYPWPSITNPWSRRKNFLLAWLTVSTLVTERNIKALAENSLQMEGLFEEAERFAEKIRQTIHSKPRAVRTVLLFLGIPVSDVKLVEFDVKNEKRISVPIPAH